MTAKPCLCTCPECVRLDRQHPREGRQLSLLSTKIKRPRASRREATI